MEQADPRHVFVAQAVTVIEESESLILSLASDKTATPGRYLVLSVPLFHDEQEEALGMQGIYVEMNSQRNSGYFPQIRAGVCSQSLTLWLTGKRDLEGAAEGVLTVGLDLPPGQMDLLKSGLNRILNLIS